MEQIKEGMPPLKITRIVKSVKYMLYWEFDTKESYGAAQKNFKVFRLMYLPFWQSHKLVVVAGIYCLITTVCSIWIIGKENKVSEYDLYFWIFIIGKIYMTMW